MIRFNNDYNRGAFDCILKALADTNTTSYPGYGEDEWCDKAEQIIKGLIGRDDSMIKFIPGATQANYVVVAAALSSVQSVIAADTDISIATRRLLLRIQVIRFLRFLTRMVKSVLRRLRRVQQSIMTMPVRSI